MAYNRQRRTQQPDRVPYPVDEDGDRLYTEEDYEIPDSRPQEWVYADEEDAAPDEAFAADGSFAADEAQPFDPFNIPQTINGFYDQEPYSTLDVLDDLDADPLADDLLTEEELTALRRSRWKLMAGLADFAGVLIGAAVILLLVMLLVSLGNWLLADIDQTFTLWKTRM